MDTLILTVLTVSNR
uniref:Uncharacterized protein n=1 Tax=Rhizophora mucronata TaxID=61149 RepID=A0A2P2R4T1_RHIMU